MDDSRETDSSRHKRTDAHKNMGLSTHIRPGQVQTGQNLSPRKGKQTQSPTPNQEVIYCWHVLGKKEYGFSRGMSPGVSTVFQGRPHAKE